MIERVKKFDFEEGRHVYVKCKYGTDILLGVIL